MTIESSDVVCLRRSVILQQPLDVIELDLRAQRIAEPTAQFLEDTAHPLNVDLVGDLHRGIVGKFTPAQRTAQRIVLVAAALLPPRALAGAVALAVAVALLHRVGQALGALAQCFQRFAL